MTFELLEAKSWLMRRAAFVNHRLWWLRAKTLGVRVIVLDGRNVLLVRHTYVPGWYFPGGAVDRGETAEAAAVRELREEAAILCDERPVLHGFFRNLTHSRRDHVACYIVRQFSAAARKPDWEIAEVDFFPVDALPEGATLATRARIAELFEGRAIGEDW
jgi:8-oxo-dGTP pyrophosphatase MutT (NUDIX family)